MGGLIMNLIQIALLAAYFTGIWYHSTLFDEIGTKEDRNLKPWRFAFAMMVVFWPIVYVLIQTARIKRFIKTKRNREK